MRQRIIGVAVAGAALALLLFLVPLAVAVLQLNLAQEHSDLEREALNAALVVDPAFSRSDQPEIPGAVPGTELALYDAAGHRIAGTGPAAADADTARALKLRAAEESQGWLVSVVPVAANEKAAGAVRAASPAAGVWQRVALQWAALLAAAMLAVAVIWLLARKLASQVSSPMEQLADASVRLGQGEFTLRVPSTGVAEVDLAGSALNAAAANLGELVTRERQLAADISHQLRTPLTGLRAILESALSDPQADLAAVASTAVGRVNQLETTIDDVMTLTRGTAPAVPHVDLAQVVEGIASAWHGPLAALGRPLRVQIEDEVPLIAVAPSAVAQILDALLDNAVKHGSGTIGITVRALDQALAVDVTDAGGKVADGDIFRRGVSGDGGSGVGLALARRLAEDLGGRLLLARRSPLTQFTLLLPRPISAARNQRCPGNSQTSES